MSIVAPETRERETLLSLAPPSETVDQGSYELRFAVSPDELDEILRLRFEVFNLELGEGLEESFSTGRDEDAFDAVCHHLLVVEKADQKIVGTYRMQTAEMAARAGGFYSADEFQIDQLPRDVLADAVELGRACIAREHRNRRVLFLLWRGLALYLSTFKKRYLFGCCSLTSQDPAAGLVLLRQLEERCVLHPEYVVAPIAGLECVCSDEDRRRCGPVELPTLFEMYLRYGALVCGSPAIDRRFKTIDYLVLLDVEDLDPQTYALFAG